MEIEMGITLLLTRLEHGVSSKEKAWIILTCVLCLALARVALVGSYLGFPLLDLGTSPGLLVYNRIRTLDRNPLSCSTMVLYSR
jgi:hypothetical protein